MSSGSKRSFARPVRHSSGLRRRTTSLGPIRPGSGVGFLQGSDPRANVLRTYYIQRTCNPYGVVPSSLPNPSAQGSPAVHWLRSLSPLKSDGSDHDLLSNSRLLPSNPDMSILLPKPTLEFPPRFFASVERSPLLALFSARRCIRRRYSSHLTHAPIHKPRAPTCPRLLPLPRQWSRQPVSIPCFYLVLTLSPNRLKRRRCCHSCHRCRLPTAHPWHDPPHPPHPDNTSPCLLFPQRRDARLARKTRPRRPRRPEAEGTCECTRAAAAQLPAPFTTHRLSGVRTPLPATHPPTAQQQIASASVAASVATTTKTF